MFIEKAREYNALGAAIILIAFEEEELGTT